MKKYKVIITKSAEYDITQIFRYISSDNRTAAVKLIDEIEQQIDSLERMPLRCPFVPESLELGR